MGRKEKQRMIKTIGFNLLVFILSRWNLTAGWSVIPPTHLRLPIAGSKGVRTTPSRYKYSLRICCSHCLILLSSVLTVVHTTITVMTASHSVPVFFYHCEFQHSSPTPVRSQTERVTLTIVVKLFSFAIINDSTKANE